MPTPPPRPKPPTTEPFLSAEELTRAAEAFAAAESELPRPYGKPPGLHHLSVSLARVRDLLNVLADANTRLHTHLAATTAPTPHLAHTASDLSHALGATGRTVNHLAAAQSAQLFIDHTPNRYGSPDVNCDFARGRITTHLAAAHEALNDVSTLLRIHTGRAEPDAERPHAARTRSPHTPVTATAPPATASPPAPTSGAPNRAKGR
jgi:hypothetical protein